jgi:hypothetical protein
MTPEEIQQQVNAVRNTAAQVERYRERRAKFTCKLCPAFSGGKCRPQLPERTWTAKAWWTKVNPETDSCLPGYDRWFQNEESLALRDSIDKVYTQEQTPARPSPKPAPFEKCKHCAWVLSACDTSSGDCPDGREFVELAQ